MPKTVAELCLERKMSAEDLAARAGIEQGRINAIVLGRWTPSPDDRRRIAAEFDVGVDEVAWGHVTPIQHLYGHGPG